MQIWQNQAQNRVESWQCQVLVKANMCRYMSPDVLALNNEEEGVSKGYDAQKSDVWSMGIILYKMLYGKEPFNGKDEAQMIKKISQKEIKFPDTIEDATGSIRPAKISKELTRLMKRMIQKDENQRIEFKELYNEFKLISKEKENSKINSAIKEEKSQALGDAKNKKQQMITIYNKLMIKIYHDAVNFATFREIGIENYYQFSCKLMTLIHQKRTNFLQNQQQGQNEEVSDKLKQQISQYHNIFNLKIKEISALKKQETLQSLLLFVYDKISEYQDYDMLMKEVQCYLLDLLLLLSLELGIVKIDFVYTSSSRSEMAKSKVIISYKTNTIKMIERYKLEGSASMAKEKEFVKMMNLKHQKLKEMQQHKDK